MIRVAINGFGRIGRNFARCWVGRENSKIELVAVNDTSDPRTNAHLLKYDSMLGKLKDVHITADDNSISVNGKTIKCVSDRNPENLPWKEWGIDLIIEATGVFTSREGSQKHLNAGAKKVLITAPGKNEDGTFVMGVNHHDYDHNQHHIISNASCTTNCLAPIAKVLNDKFKIIKGTMTTTHSYTGDQRLLDASHRDLRRARAAAECRCGMAKKSTAQRLMTKRPTTWVMHRSWRGRNQSKRPGARSPTRMLGLEPKWLRSR